MSEAAFSANSLPLKIWFETGLFLFCGALGYALFRFALLLYYGQPLLDYSWQQLFPVFWMGLRFDLKVYSIFGLLWVIIYFLFNTFCYIWARVRRRSFFWEVRWGGRALLGIFLLILNCLAVAQHGYFGFYRTMFDPIVFGLINDDTKAVLSTMWDGYPVIRMILLILSLTFVESIFIYRVGKNAFLKVKNVWLTSLGGLPGRSFRLVLNVVSFIALCLLARGSLGTFPLMADDATVGNNSFLNAITQNSVVAIYDSYTVYMNQIRITKESVLQTLHDNGFRDITDLAQALGRSLSPEERLQPVSKILDTLVYKQTSGAAVARPAPHVVFVQMESWGEYFWHFHSARNNLLGEFEKHTKNGYVFRNFVSATLGTFPTLEFLLFNSPLTPLTQGSHGLCSQPLATTRVFKEAGYRTVFVYGGSGFWRSLKRTMPHQYFDEVYDQADILAQFPAGENNSYNGKKRRHFQQLWGVYDEYLFRFAQALFDTTQKASKQDHRPIFLYMVTTTNHPPYAPPSDYQPLPLDVEVMKPVTAYSSQEALAALETYQYSTRQLGLFLDSLDRAPWGGKTLLVATGDHNMRAFFNLEQPARSLDLFAVPAYFRVPSLYRPTLQPDVNRFASHRDLFPTIYALALNHARVPQFGENLMSPVIPERRGATMGNILFSDQGMAVLGENPTFQGWQPKGSRHLVEAPASELLKQQAAYAHALRVLQEMAVRHGANTDCP